MWQTFKELMRDWRYLLSFGLGLVGALIGLLSSAERSPWFLLFLLIAPAALVMNFAVQRWFIRRLGGTDSAVDLRVTQKRVFVMEMPFDQAFDSCSQSITSLRRGRLGRRNKVKGRISGRTLGSWRSLGDRIQYRLTGLDENRTRVELTSHPLYHTTLVDYGSNYDNAERLTAALGVRPDQYLLRASNESSGDEALLRAASGAGEDNGNLLRASTDQDTAVYSEATCEEPAVQQQTVG